MFTFKTSVSFQERCKVHSNYVCNMFVEKILELCKDINEIPVKLSESGNSWNSEKIKCLSRNYKLLLIST
jgi:hypothetical protein